MVLGMHRSGTSALAGALHHSGLPVADDVLPANGENSDGYFESSALVGVNDRILATLDGEWSAPPRLDRGFQSCSELGKLRSMALEAVNRFLPTGGVWKDPRNCLPLPFWSQTIDRSSLTVLIWRNPMAVAESLRRRNEFGAVLSLALWAAYNKAALENLRGRRVLVLSYEEMLADPNRSAVEVVEFLRGGSLSLPLRDNSEAHFAAFLDGNLRHDTAERAGQAELLLDDQENLVDVLGRLRGGHEAFALPPIKDESPWSSEILRGRIAQIWLSDFGSDVKLLAPLLKASRSLRLATRPIRHRLRSGADR